MLSIEPRTVVVAVHVLAATVWVGGQVVLAALVPTLRRAAPGATAVAARTYAMVAWPALAVLLVTGAWNVASRTATEDGYWTTLSVKLALVGLSAAAAALHQRTASPPARAASAAVSLAAAVAALFLGVVLGQHG